MTLPGRPSGSIAFVDGTLRSTARGRGVRCAFTSVVLKARSAARKWLAACERDEPGKDGTSDCLVLTRMLLRELDFTMQSFDQHLKGPVGFAGDKEDIRSVPEDPFHRVENTTTQTKSIARMQEQSREIWGRSARGSGQPSVKAYPGSLPNRRGVEFTTDIKPMPGSAPNEARWYWEWCAGVQLRHKAGEDFACISVITFTNGQP